MPSQFLVTFIEPKWHVIDVSYVPFWFLRPDEPTTDPLSARALVVDLLAGAVLRLISEGRDCREDRASPHSASTSGPRMTHAS